MAIGHPRWIVLEQSVVGITHALAFEKEGTACFLVGLLVSNSMICTVTRYWGPICSVHGSMSRCRFRLRVMAVRSWLRWLWMPQPLQSSWTTWPLEVPTQRGLWHILMWVWGPYQLQYLLSWTHHCCTNTLPGELSYFRQHQSIWSKDDPSPFNTCFGWR